ncbi:MAG: formylglycine-generating enzyme family protein [Nitrosomonadales bacterium]|nr:formylglycine-generating enzyme family protein [Nitrosomonadales bacterium]
MKFTHLVLFLSFAIPAGAPARDMGGDIPYQHVIQATETCHSCHERSQVDEFNSKMASDCEECHTSGESGPIVRVADVKTEKKAYNDPYLNGMDVAPPPSATAGMSVPMYYAETRIGQEPHRMVLIPAGKFQRGTNNRLPDEGPQYTAETKAFWMDKYEVTNLQYKQFIDATNRKSPGHFRNRTYPQGKVDHPVVFVSWFDAHDYCVWAGKRLPTDIEWEKAARGADDDRYFPWGDDFDATRLNSPVRWKTLKMDGDTTPVGAFEGGKSPYGLYDMSGNVWEWTDSWYTQYPGNNWPSENYGEQYKVLKGGSWFDCSYYQCGVSAPVFNRSYFKQNIKNSSFGFRCAKDAN